MARAEHTVVVERPPEEVFAYLTDLSNVPSWQSGSVEVREPEGSIGLGTSYATLKAIVEAWSARGDSSETDTP